MIRIAVCDDERPVRESIVKALGKYKTETGTDIEVLEFSDAETLLTSYPSGLDLILLDIYMPGMDGMEAAKAIRKFDTEVCIIFITGSVIDILSCTAEIAILLWFFSRKNERRDIGDDPVRKVIGFLPLLVLLGIYMTPLNATVSVFSLENLAIQLLRMILHLLPAGM